MGWYVDFDWSVVMIIFFCLDLDVVGVRKKEGRKERQQGKKGGKRMLK